MNMTLAYVGDKGRNLFLRAWGNKIVSLIQGSDPTKAATVVRQFSIVNGTSVQNPYAEIDYKTSGGKDTYDSMQLSLGRRFTTGLTLNSQYTWGRSYGNNSGSNDALTANNPYDFNYDFGYNNFDVRQSFNLSAVYALPMGKQGSAASRVLLGGWELGTTCNQCADRAAAGCTRGKQRRRLCRPGGSLSQQPSYRADGGNQYARRRCLAQRTPS
jgi:hypothetical protein